MSYSGSAVTYRRVMIFIDGSNFLGGLTEYEKNPEKKYKISYLGLLDGLLSSARHGLIELEHIKTYFYGPKGTPEELKEKVKKLKNFSEQIEEFRSELIQHHVKLVLKDKIKGKEKGIDVTLATDFLALAYSGAYDYAILVSGDADYITAIDEVKRLGKMVYVASFKSHFNAELLQHIDKVIYLDSNIGGILTEKMDSK